MTGTCACSLILLKPALSDGTEQAGERGGGEDAGQQGQDEERRSAAQVVPQL
jgi:hypothetical protein